MKAAHHNFKTKQQAVEGDETCVCFASFGPRSLRIGLQRVSKPSTTTLKLTKAIARPPEFAHFKISGNIMPIVIFGHMAPSSCVRTKLTRPVHIAHQDPNGEKKQIGFRRSPALTSECMQINRCQGRKASRSVPSNRLFPMMTVTNDSQNRSTLNSCNFAVPGRMELNFFALES